MNEEDNTAIAGEPAPTSQFEENPNVQARKRAGKRSANRNAGKPIEDGVTDSGIVGEAEKEVEAVIEETAELPVEEAVETPVEETSEKEPPKTTIEQYAEEEAAEPEHQGSNAVQQFAAEEAQEPEHQQPIGEYTPPEGPSHDELIDQYHDALVFGDIASAKQLYRQLQEHRFQENMHRGKSVAQAEKEANEYLTVAKQIAADHPELAEDGLAANRVLALSDVYRNEGQSAAAALKQAVADLYPMTPMIEAAPVEEPAPVAPIEEPIVAPLAEEPPLIPSMEERMASKRAIPGMPSASARNEAPPPPPKPTRETAIEEMKRKRGQM